MTIAKLSTKVRGCIIRDYLLNNQYLTSNFRIDGGPLTFRRSFLPKGFRRIPCLPDSAEKTTFIQRDSSLDLIGLYGGVLRIFK